MALSANLSVIIDRDMIEATVMLVSVDQYHISKSINKIKPMEKK